MEIPRYRPSLLERIVKVFGVNRLVAWHKLPSILGVVNLIALRVYHRSNNLFQGYASSEPQGNSRDSPLPDERFLHARHSDGKFNSLDMPRMGCAGMRFGRQFPREHCKKPTERELWTLSPRVISQKFMARQARGFIPATSLKLLAAAWIQFQTHDWFNHEKVTADPCGEDASCSDGSLPGRLRVTICLTSLFPPRRLEGPHEAGQDQARRRARPVRRGDAGLQPEHGVVGRVADLRLKRSRHAGDPRQTRERQTGRVPRRQVWCAPAWRDGHARDGILQLVARPGDAAHAVCA